MDTTAWNTTATSVFESPYPSSKRSSKAATIHFRSHRAEIDVTAVMSLLAKEISELHDLHGLLDRIYVRNKNQHRRSAWFKDLRSFRRNLGQIMIVLDGRVSGDRASQLRYRLSFWEEFLTFEWYLSFSQLVANGQFAAIGVVLLATLARVCALLGITRSYLERPGKKVKTEIESLAIGEALKVSGQMEAAEGEDEGVVVQREE
ncbi:hypothetical protein K432DRAFT_288122 [Lepidopterella palustris CBS 459.81]|uniref:RNase MRP protein 1 RNA binding domain-containing protein n=1 Tax=Lepidopterella palustris CBS 459.81 TaxID=1314670 RepID=A0A8E2JJK6_9PEZI|nr:hypothetical protein K432DRAFT_288122 [Lepidopterella palustris CBS 459.81]